MKTQSNSYGSLPVEEFIIISDPDGIDSKKEQKIQKQVHKYRADIDGLRAISIILVYQYHNRHTILGGLLGVDIFFVISGYLISTVIFKQYEKTGELSYLNFYARRIRRIFPTLIVMLLSVNLIVYMRGSIADIQEVSSFTIASAFMCSNFYSIYLEYLRGYGDHLWSFIGHLWSLGVEEQFYLIWPLVAGCIWKIQSKVLGFILISFMCLLSYGFARKIQFLYPRSAYAYHLPFSRFWTLGVGCLVAYYECKNNNSKNKSSEIISTLYLNKFNNSNKKQNRFVYFFWKFVGIIRRTLSIKALISMLGGYMIYYALLKIDGTNFMYPNQWVVCGSVGAGLIIAGGQGFFNEYILGNRLMTFIGKISYAVYLFHIPALQLSWKMHFGDRVTSYITCIFYAIFVTYVIQNNLRSNKSQWVVPLLLIAMVMIICIALNGRYDPQSLLFIKEWNK